MALPEGALRATITVGAASGVAGTPAIITGFTVESDCELTWAPTGEKIETFPDPGEGADGQIVVVADQPGVLTSSTVDGQPAMVEVRAWPLIARWRTTSGPEVRDHRRVLPAPAPGATVDLDMLPKGGVVAPGPVTHAQTILVGADLVPAVQDAAASAEADAASASVSADSAELHAGQAAVGATSAASSAGTAAAAAEAAQQSAIEADGFAAAASLSEGAAAGSADDAAGSATAAHLSATAAAASAELAAPAEQHAANAAQSAVDAQEFSETAGAAAGSATTAATSAAASASDAASSATNAADSAATAADAQAATEAVDFNVGTVTTGAPGTDADFTITGPAPDFTLDLTIPRGDPGPPNTLAIGTVTTGAPGSNAAASITGTPPSQALDLTIPQGDPGVQIEPDPLDPGVLMFTFPSPDGWVAPAALPEYTINVTSPGQGLTAWSRNAGVDNAAAIRETFAWINAEAISLGDNTTFTIIIPQGTYRHSGVDLADLMWPGGFGRINIVGTPGLRRSTLWCTNVNAKNLALYNTWGMNINDVAFYGGLHGLYLDNCQYVRLAGCTFEQQKPAVGACLYVRAGQNISVDRCNFLQSHSAFVWLTGSTTVQVRNSLIGEAIQGAYVDSATLVVQDSAWFGVGSEHTSSGAAIYVGTTGNVLLQNNQIRLAAGVTKVIEARYPGWITMQGNSFTYLEPLTVIDCFGLSSRDYRCQSIEGNAFTGQHALTVAAFASAADVPRNSIVMGNRFNFTYGTAGTLIIPAEMVDPSRNNIVEYNIVRATTTSN